MTTNELITILSERLDCTQVESKKTFDSTMEIFKEIIGKENVFSLPKFGTFSTKKKNKRKSFNPKLNKHLELPAKNVLTFKPSNFLKEQVKDWVVEK